MMPKAKRVRLTKHPTTRLLGDACPHCGGKGSLPARNAGWSIRWNYQDGNEWSKREWESQDDVEKYLSGCELTSVQVEVYSPAGHLYTIA